MKHLVLFIAFVTGSASLSLNAHEADHHENESGQQEAGNGLDEGNGFILKAGGGEPVINGIVIKASPKTALKDRYWSNRPFHGAVTRSCIFMIRVTSFFTSYQGKVRRDCTGIQHQLRWEM